MTPEDGSTHPGAEPEAASGPGPGATAKRLLPWLVAVGFGAWNLFAFTPRLAVAEGTLPDETQSAALGKVVRNVWYEFCLSSLVLFVVVLLGITAPATHP